MIMAIRLSNHWSEETWTLAETAGASLPVFGS